MKTSKLFLIAIALLTLSACKSRVYLTVSEPAAVYIENEYETAGVINRSYSSGVTKPLDVLDNALGLEGNLDHEGSKVACQAVVDELSTIDQFKKVELLDSMTVKGGGIDIFPAQLPWDEVQKICDKNGVQLLFVLEVFDTDTKVDITPTTSTQNTPLGNVTIPSTNVTMVTTIKTGWRIYDPKNKWVRDEFWVRDKITQKGKGTVDSFGTLARRGQMVKQIAGQVGRFYARRVIPQRFRVWRNYFTGGSSKLKIGKRRSQVGDWDGAAKMWEEETRSHKRKVAGRACYNMAIYAEINGDLYGALDWAQKAYSDYKNKEALDYANILRRRIKRWEDSQVRKEMDEQGE